MYVLDDDSLAVAFDNLTNPAMTPSRTQDKFYVDYLVCCRDGRRAGTTPAMLALPSNQVSAQTAELVGKGETSYEM